MSELAPMASTAELIAKSNAYVQEQMLAFDASHDFEHVKRVVALARSILAHEQKSSAEQWPAAEQPTMGPGKLESSPSRSQLREDLVVLSALLHDVGDRKYLPPGVTDGKRLVLEFLVSAGADGRLAQDVQDIVNHVSFTTEMRDPESVRACLARLPELAVVQDADRLDAIGAVGIARCFAYTGATTRRNGSGGQGGLQDAVRHFEEKLERLEGMMKTRTGREMAAERTKRLREFREWWDEETSLGFGDDDAVLPGLR